MPRQSATRYRVVKDFDFFVRPGVIMAFKAGEERAGLTKAQIERGFSLGAIVQIASDKE